MKYRNTIVAMSLGLAGVVGVAFSAVLWTPPQPDSGATIETDPRDSSERPSGGSGMDADPARATPSTDLREDAAAFGATASRPSVSAIDPGVPALLVESFVVEGEPLPGCRFELRRVVAGEDRSPLVLTEVRDGVHHLESCEPGRYDLYCTTPMIRDRLAAAVIRAGEQTKLRIDVAERDNVVGGTLVRSDGLPARDAFLCDEGDAAEELYCRTDDRGRFMFHRRSGFAGRSSSFEIVDGLGEARVVDSPTPELSWGVYTHRIGVAARRALEIRMTDALGSVIPEFDVKCVVHNVFGLTVRRGRADAGVVSLEGLPTGAGMLVAVPGELKWQSLTSGFTVGRDGGGTILLRGEPATILSGTVEWSGSPAEPPVTAVRVTKLESDGHVGSSNTEPVVTTASDRVRSELSVVANVVDGAFAFGVDPRSRYVLSVEAEGFSPFRSTVEASGGSFPETKVYLAAASQINLALVPPEAGRWLRVFGEQQHYRRGGGMFVLAQKNRASAADRLSFTASATDDGRVSFSNVPSGEWLLWLRSPAGNRLLAEPRISPDSGAHELIAELEDLRPGFLHGWVRSPSGSGTIVGIRLIKVGGNDMHVSLDEGGRFDMSLPSGEYQARFTVELGERRVEVMRAESIYVIADRVQHLDADVALGAARVRVIGDESGRPVAGAKLSIDEARAAGEFRSVVTDASGVAELFPAPLGAFGVSILDEDGDDWEHLVRIGPGAADPVVVRVSR